MAIFFRLITSTLSAYLAMSSMLWDTSSTVVPVFLWYSFTSLRMSVPSLRVKARSRLVQHKNAGPHGHNARHGHPALLAAGKLKGTALQQGRVKAHEIGGFMHAAVDLGFVQPMFLGAERDIL